MYSKEQILNMPVGEELDKLVMTTLGYELIELHEGDKAWWNEKTKKCLIKRGYKPSRKIRCAWEILTEAAWEYIWSINPTADGFNIVYDHGREMLQVRKAEEGICKVFLLGRLGLI